MTHKRSLVQIQYGPLLEDIEPCFTAGSIFYATVSSGSAGRSGMQHSLPAVLPQYRPTRKPGLHRDRPTGVAVFSPGFDRRWTASVDSPRSRRRVITIKALHAARRPEARTVRDDSPAQQRPKWVSAVKSPLRGGVPSGGGTRARDDSPLALARRPHSRTLPSFLAYQWPPSGYDRRRSVA